ncbi:OLC1v1025479C1 [Oldenlandia corymbosa var. corymbosa]|uniref:OLC1v1025479C1 n=1 Tax=Oldenlandia corymbosa var. corymbosa TaxID=529605 RepID=A0AAV1C890_OLDCO|nr:OLC1v1025479C1 [Oldenlandia corymbosa var. corymbosa]
MRRAVNIQDHRRYAQPGTGGTLAHSSGGSRRRTGGSDQNTYFHEWLLYELLYRLPLKAVFRFNCVSKQWRSVISDPRFRTFYLSRRQGSPSSGHKFVCFSPIVGLIDENPDTKTFITGQIPTESHPGSPELQRFTLPRALRGRLSSKENQSFCIKAADDNGFLLIARERPSVKPIIVEFCICNAITKQWLLLPAHKILKYSVSVGFVTQTKDGILTSFRVVVLVWPYNQEFFDLQLFSSETGKWIDLRVSGDRPCFVYNGRAPVVLNNTLHWMDENGGIIAYDPYSHLNRFRYIALPRALFRRFRKCNNSCFVYQGEKLWFFENVEASIDGAVAGLKLWELQDNHHQWLLKHDIRFEDIMFPSSPNGDDGFLYSSKYAAAFASFHPFDPDVIYLYWGSSKGIMSFDMTTRRLESLNWSSWKEGHSWTKFLFRVVPFWPISIPGSLKFIRS